MAGIVIRRIALDDEAVGGRERREVDHLPVEPAGVDRGAEARRLAEHHVGLAGIVAAVVAARRPDDQIGEAVAVHVAGRGDAEAGIVIRRIALDDEAVGGRERREIDHLPVEPAGVDRVAEARRLAEHHVSLAGVTPPSSPPGAPTIRSSKPSPFTSPAAETLKPA